MGYEKLGSDQAQLAGFGGGVISEEGAVLLSGESTGEEALLFGPAALREVQAGVANGDFAIPPLDPLATIVQDGNPLPYFKYTDVNSAGAITAAIIADAGAASGNVLRFTVASGTLTGKSATLTRFIPIASSASRSFSFYAEATFDTGTNSTQATATLSCQFFAADQVTPTGTAFTSGAYGFNSLQGPTGITAPDLYAVAPDLTSVTAPADAAYLKITITIATIATQSAARTVDLTEVRVAHGLPELLLTDKVDPATYPPAFLTSAQGELNIQNGKGDYLLLANDTFLIAATTVGITAGSGDATITGGTNVELVAPSGVNITTDGSTLGTLNVGAIADTGDLLLRAGGGDVIVQDTGSTTPRILFRNNADTFLGGIGMQGTNIFHFYNGSVTNDYGYIYAQRIYPMDSTTASRYIFDNGAQTAFSGAVLTGTLTSTGNVSGTNFTASTITGTTLTTNAAIWVLTAGTTYNLRRNTSSARYKTAITDADDAVLTAARQVRPRHYQSTIADEQGATRLGFIAEEVHDAGLTHAVGYDEQGRPETLDSTALIAALWHRVNDLEARLAAIEAKP